MHSAGETAD